MALFKQAANAVEGDDKAQLNSIVAGLQDVVNEEDDKKKQGRFQSIVQGAKDFVSLEKAMSTLGKNYNRISEMVDGFQSFI
jgi:hypothetical protein